MKRFAVLVAACVLGACYAAFDWREVSWPAGGFSVLLPKKPAVETREVAIGAHRLKMDLLSVRVENVSLGVGYAELPQSIDDAGRAQLLADARDGFVKSVGATPEADRIVSLDGHVGREFRAEGTRDGRPLVIAGRIYATDRRFLQLVAVMPKEKAAEVDLPLFLGSLKLLK